MFNPDLIQVLAFGVLVRATLAAETEIRHPKPQDLCNGDVRLKPGYVRESPSELLGFRAVGVEGLRCYRDAVGDRVSCRCSCPRACFMIEHAQ